MTGTQTGWLVTWLSAAPLAYGVWTKFRGDLGDLWAVLYAVFSAIVVFAPMIFYSWHHSWRGSVARTVVGYRNSLQEIPTRILQKASEKIKEKEKKVENRQADQTLRDGIRNDMPEILGKLRYEERGGKGSFFIDGTVYGTVPQRSGHFAASDDQLDKLVDLFFEMYKE